MQTPIPKKEDLRIDDSDQDYVKVYGQDSGAEKLIAYFKWFDTFDKFMHTHIKSHFKLYNVRTDEVIESIYEMEPDFATHVISAFATGHLP
jgi:predicted SpoU family rRNA methylase